VSASLLGLPAEPSEAAALPGRRARSALAHVLSGGAMPQFTSPRPINLTLRKPRNPLVAPALLRQAGRHQSTREASRMQARQQVKRALRDDLPDDSP
jgi:hypothetical protein